MKLKTKFISGFLGTASLVAILGFINIQTDQQCSAGDVFRQIYTGAEHMVLQTCIAKDEVPEWGRIFIIAEPIP